MKEKLPSCFMFIRQALWILKTNFISLVVAVFLLFFTFTALLLVGLYASTIFPSLGIAFFIVLLVVAICYPIVTAFMNSLIDAVLFSMVRDRGWKINIIDTYIKQRFQAFSLLLVNLFQSVIIVALFVYLIILAGILVEAMGLEAFHNLAQLIPNSVYGNNDFLKVLLYWSIILIPIFVIWVYISLASAVCMYEDCDNLDAIFGSIRYVSGCWWRVMPNVVILLFIYLARFYLVYVLFFPMVNFVQASGYFSVPWCIVLVFCFQFCVLLLVRIFSIIYQSLLYENISYVKSDLNV